MQTTIPLPLFAYLLKDFSGAAYLQVRRKPGIHSTPQPADYVLALFTSAEYARAYATRSNNLDLRIVELSTVETVLSFVEDPPSRLGHSKIEFDIVIDPIAPDTGEFVGFTREKFLAILRKHAKP